MSIIDVDAIIIGGGFYGTVIAIYLAKQRGLKRVVLIEKEANPLSRASYHNQARVHNGYHYPRSFTTAFRSRVNLPKFVNDWPNAVFRNFTKLYAIAKRNSKVTANQFERFCHQIDARIERAEPKLQKLFNRRLIEDVFLTEEYAFDSTKLAEWAKKEMSECGVDAQYKTIAKRISLTQQSKLQVHCCDSEQQEISLNSRYVFNCTYSGLNQLAGDFPSTHTSLKHETTEMALLKVPNSLSEIGITVMDGPFFSLMPFPARGLHTLSHVRYTPHFSWADEPGVDPYERLRQYNKESRVDRMVRDAGRYLPAILSAKHEESLFEIKTVLSKNESDDGRPILFERYANLPGCYSVLGGKVDNIYDVIEILEREPII